MRANPTLTSINGSGTPRIIAVKGTAIYQSPGSAGETYTATTAKCPVSRGCTLSGSGKYGYKSSPGNLNFASGSFSAHAWVKTSAVAAGYVFDRWDPTSYGWQLYVNASGYPVLHLRSGATELYATSTKAVNDGVFHLLTVSVDRVGNNAILYVDGANPQTANITGLGALFNSTYLTVGSQQGGATYFNGVLGEMQLVSGYAFSASDILGVLSGGLPAAWASGTLVYHAKWRGATDVAFLADETGNNSLTAVSITQASNQAVADYLAIDSLSRVIQIGMALRSQVTGTPNTDTFGKVLSVNTATDTLTIDSWTLGTPTNGNALLVDGWIIDLPRTQGLNEQFLVNQVLHGIFRGKKASRQYGWNYTCTLDYSAAVAADVVSSLYQVLSIGPTDNLILIPRADQPQFQYNVYFTQDPLNLMKFSLQAGFYKGLKLILAAKDLVASFPVFSSGYGFGYGTNYGVEL